VPLMLVIFVGCFSGCGGATLQPASICRRLRGYLQAERASWVPGGAAKRTCWPSSWSWSPYGHPRGAGGGGRAEVQQAFSRRFPEEITALLAPVLLFLLPIDWRRREFSLAAEDFLGIDWGTVLLFGAG